MNMQGLPVLILSSGRLQSDGKVVLNVAICDGM